MLLSVLSCSQSCRTLCKPMDCSPPGSSVHGFPRQEYGAELPFPPPGDLPNPRIETASPVCPVSQADSLQLSHLGSPPVVTKHSLKTLRPQHVQGSLSDHWQQPLALLGVFLKCISLFWHQPREDTSKNYLLPENTVSWTREQQQQFLVYCP